MFIDSTTCMRHGHIQGGLTGVTLNDNATVLWDLTLHSCSHLIRDLISMRDVLTKEESVPIIWIRTHHLEESKVRIQTDNSDRRTLRERLDQYVDPSDLTGHYAPLFNIVSEKRTAASVNVQNALQIGRACHVSPRIHPANGLTREQPQLLTRRSYSTEHGIIGSEEFNLHNFFSHELAPIATSPFLDDGSIRSSS